MKKYAVLLNIVLASTIMVSCSGRDNNQRKTTKVKESIMIDSLKRRASQQRQSNNDELSVEEIVFREKQDDFRFSKNGFDIEIYHEFVDDYSIDTINDQNVLRVLKYQDYTTNIKVKDKLGTALLDTVISKYIWEDKYGYDFIKRTVYMGCWEDTEDKSVLIGSTCIPDTDDCIWFRGEINVLKSDSIMFILSPY